MYSNGPCNSNCSGGYGCSLGPVVLFWYSRKSRKAVPHAIAPSSLVWFVPRCDFRMNAGYLLREAPAPPGNCAGPLPWLGLPTTRVAPGSAIISGFRARLVSTIYWCPFTFFRIPMTYLTWLHSGATHIDVSSKVGDEVHTLCQFVRTTLLSDVSPWAHTLSERSHGLHGHPGILFNSVWDAYRKFLLHIDFRKKHENIRARLHSSESLFIFHGCD